MTEEKFSYLSPHELVNHMHTLVDDERRLGWRLPKLAAVCYFDLISSFGLSSLSAGHHHRCTVTATLKYRAYYQNEIPVLGFMKRSLTPSDR